MMQECTTNFSLQAFPTLDLVSSHSAQPKDTPFRFLAPILAIVLQHRFKVLQQKVPPTQMYFDFYMPLNSTAQTPAFFIILQHLISILTLNYITTLLSHWRSEIHQQPAQ